MCAMMPIFRILSSGVVRGTAFTHFSSFGPPPAFRWQASGQGPALVSGPALPAIVREGLVRFCHAVRVFALLDRSSLVPRRGQDLRGQLLEHGVVRPLAPVPDQPAHGEPVA